MIPKTLLFAVVSLANVMVVSVINAAQPLPQYDNKIHTGLATCASTKCHGATKKFKDSPIRRNEYRTWIKEDPHAGAYNLLKNSASKKMAKKMGLATPAHKAKICLDCHTDNVPKNKRGKKFQISDGVGCEACHGGAQEWLKSHAEKNSSHKKNLTKGLYPTEDSLARAKLCLSCHFGTSKKFATHEIMAAGHPRLSFELDSFTIQQEHYDLDKDYYKRKIFDDSLKVWIIGVLETAKHSLQAITQNMSSNVGLFPEIALFDCHACHHSMNDLRWTSRATTSGLTTGAIRLNDSSLIILYVILSEIEPSQASKLLKGINDLHRSTLENRLSVSRGVVALMSQINGLLKTLPTQRINKSLAKPILARMLKLGGKGEFRDYVAAEQAVLASDLLLFVLKQSDRYAAQVDKLYKILEKESEYAPTRFAEAMRQFSKAF